MFLILSSTATSRPTGASSKTFLPPASPSTCSYMQEVWFFNVKPHFFLTFPRITASTREKREGDRERQRERERERTNIFSLPRAEDFLILSVTQNRIVQKKKQNSTRDFGISPISCRCGHAHTPSVSYPLLYHVWKNTSNKASRSLDEVCRSPLQCVNGTTVIIIYRIIWCVCVFSFFPLNKGA